jgi:CBS domain containing-hemolysin-like protein
MFGIYETVFAIYDGYFSAPFVADAILSFDLSPLLASSVDTEPASAPSDGLSVSQKLISLVIALVLVVINGFFVAAEFALVKVRPTQIDKMVREKKAFANTAQWLAGRLDNALAACQLGITMASLALGWVGEPAFASLIEPAFQYFGLSDTALHVVAFIFAFSTITALHLVVGEQAPKIFAIREPEKMVRWCALPMKLSYYLLFPFMYVLNWITTLILAKLGLRGETGHGAPHSEEDIRAILAESHVFGHLSKSEHRLINAVFEFDDMICRYVMVPRNEVEFLDVNEPFPKLLAKAKQSKFTRYPVCDSSLDSLLGVVHTKDFLGIAEDADFDIKSLMREPTKVPENMPISNVLKHFQTTHQLLTFVIDEYGAIIGIVTLENVLEKIIGPVDDEFDALHQPKIKSLGDGKFIIQGSTHIADVERTLDLSLDPKDVDTVAGVLMSRSGKIPEKGDIVDFDGARAEILEVKHDHAELIRFSLVEATDPDGGATKTEQH